MDVLGWVASSLVLGLAALWVAAGILATIFWLWMLVDAALNEPRAGHSKLVWVLIILATYIVGALLYFVARRHNRPMAAG